ncbi:hypothetical protein EJB05_52704, partial [Eragrostis curvula]
MAAEALVRLPLRSAPPWARLPPSSAPYPAHGEMPLLSSSAAVATSQVLQAATPQQKHGLVLDDSDSDNEDGTSSFSVDSYADEFVPETEPQDLEGMAMLSCPAGQTGGGDGVFAPNSGTTETDAETEDENKTDDTDDPAPSLDVYWNDYELTILRDCIPGFKGKSLKRNLELIKEGIESQADQDCAETTEANTIEEDEVVDNSNTGQGKTKKKSAASKSAAGTEEGKTKKTTNNTPEGDVPESSAAGQRKGRKKSSTSMQVADTNGVKAKRHPSPRWRLYVQIKDATSSAYH